MSLWHKRAGVATPRKCPRHRSGQHHGGGGGGTHHRRGRKYVGSRAGGGGEGRTARLVLSRPGVGSQGGCSGSHLGLTDSTSSWPRGPSSTRAVTRTENKTNINICRSGWARVRPGDNDVSVPGTLTSQTIRAMDVRPIIINGLLQNNQPQWCILTNIHLVQRCKKYKYYFRGNGRKEMLDEIFCSLSLEK